MTKKKQAELIRLRKEAADINKKISLIEASDRVEQGKELVGKCFKVRNNYSCPEKPSDYWWMYFLVTAIDDHGWLTRIRFEIDKNGGISIEQDIALLPSSFAGYTEISFNEFAGAWLELGKQVSKIGSEIVRQL